MSNLSQGDIAIVQYNATDLNNGQGGFTFLLLKGVDASTTIQFTSAGLDTSGKVLSTGATWTWTSGQNLAAGATVTISNTTLGGDYTKASVGTVTTTSDAYGDGSLSLLDQVFVYQGTLTNSVGATVPNLLFGLGFNSDNRNNTLDPTTGWNTADSTSLTQSRLPTSISNDQIAFLDPTNDSDGFYKGAQSGFANSQSFFQAITNRANWTTSASYQAQQTYSFSLSTPAPSVPSITGLTAATDSGTVGDNRTDDSTPSISGTGAGAGDTVTVYLDGSTTALGTTMASGSGNWTYTFGSQLSIAQHSVAVTDTHNGATSGQSASYTLTIDPIPGAPSVSGLTAATDTGAYSTDGLTKATTVGAQGTGTNGDTINVYVDGSTTSAGSVKVSGGSWSIATLSGGALGQGQHSLAATQTDPYGNVSTPSSAYSFDVDTTPPMVTLDKVSFTDTGIQGDGITNNPSVTLSGTVSDNLTVARVDVFDGGGTTLGVASVSGRLWTLTTSTLAEGTHTGFSAIATDLAGNTTQSAANSTSVQVDTTAPTLASASVNGKQLVLTYTETGSGLNGADAPVATGFTVRDGWNTILVDYVDYDVANKTATLNLFQAVANGDTVTVSYSPAPVSSQKIQDNAGNVAASFSNQAVTNNTPAGGSVRGQIYYDNNSNGILDEGDTLVAGVHVELNARDGTLLAVKTPPADGFYNFGNVAPGTDNLTLDVSTIPAGYMMASPLPISVTFTPGSTSTVDIGITKVPKIAITAPIAGDNVINAAEAAAGVTISGTSSVGSGQLVDVVFGTASNPSVGQFEAYTNSSGAWSVSVPSNFAGFATPPSDGAYTVTANVQDQFGNKAPTTSQAITIDTTLPTVTAITTAEPSLAVGGPERFNVTFSEAVTGVAASDFQLTTTNTGGTALTTGEISSITGGGTTYVVTVSAVAGNGTLRLDLKPNSTNIVDGAGNGAGAAFTSGDTYTIDQIPPTVTGVAAVTSTGTSDLKAGTSVTFTLTGSEALTVDPTTKLRLSNGAAAAYASGSGTTTPTFTYIVASGRDTPDLKVIGYIGTITDLAGNSLAPGITADTGIRIDTAAPASPSAPTLTAGSDSGVKGDGLTNVTTPTVTGLAEANALVTLYDTDGTVLGTQQLTGGATTYAVAAPLSNGTHALSVTATDLAGNASPHSPALSVTVDTTPPTIAIMTPIAGDNVINQAEAKAGATIAGTTSGVENGQNVTIKLVNSAKAVVDTYTGAVSDNAWRIAVPAADATKLANGAYTLTADVADKAGNSATAATSSVTVDANIPTPVITSGPGNSRSRYRTISGTAEANATVTIMDYSARTHAVSVLGQVKADASGNWSDTIAFGSRGAHAVEAIATDAVGNSATSQAKTYGFGAARYNLFVQLIASLNPQGVGVFAPSPNAQTPDHPLAAPH